MFGGALIGLRSRDSLTFYDWEHTATICCLDEIVPNNIYWYVCSVYYHMCADFSVADLLIVKV